MRHTTFNIFSGNTSNSLKSIKRKYKIAILSIGNDSKDTSVVIFLILLNAISNHRPRASSLQTVKSTFVFNLYTIRFFICATLNGELTVTLHHYLINLIYNDESKQQTDSICYLFIMYPLRRGCPDQEARDISSNRIVSTSILNPFFICAV